MQGFLLRRSPSAVNALPQSIREHRQFQRSVYVHFLNIRDARPIFGVLRRRLPYFQADAPADDAAVVLANRRIVLAYCHRTSASLHCEWWTMDG